MSEMNQLQITFIINLENYTQSIKFIKNFNKGKTDAKRAD